RATRLDSRISIATVYRTLRLFEEANILEKHDFGDGRARYEEVQDDHHDHLIDIKSGKVIEFFNEEIEAMKERIAKELGYELIDHRLELLGKLIRSPDEGGSE
ncbi:MAG: transcriptional repressor, partial [Alphaproteobacteria bacterium]